MRIAVMQPYIFPYIGYFQLIGAVDKFVIYDDVNYINKGWVNRNNILLNGSPHLFTVPLNKSSQNKLINEIEVSGDSKWKEKFLKTLKAAYIKAPYFDDVYPLIEKTINSGIFNLANFLRGGLLEVLNYLEILTKIVNTSSSYNNKQLKGEDRIIDICKKENATEYINPIGGLSIYDEKKFADKGIDLLFLQTGAVRYKQTGEEFNPNLSIIDVMMFNTKKDCKELLGNYSLIQKGL